jgi:phytoene desaturase
MDLSHFPIVVSKVEWNFEVARQDCMSHHRPTNSPQKIVIVGAGMGGLATAARLAKKGHSVSIFEASNFAGGKCRTEQFNGYSFDTGPSLLTLPAVYRDLFLKTGKRLEHVLKLQPVDPAFTYIFHDGTEIVFPNLSHNGTVSAIAKVLGEQAGRDWHALLQRAESMWEASRESFIEGELRSPLQFLKRATFLQDLRNISPWMSLRHLTATYTNNPYLQKIVDRYATYTGSDPRKVPAVLLTIAFVEEAFGAWHIEGGLGRLPLALEERVRELGVELQLNTRVTKILTENGVASGIELSNGETVRADVVIANADAHLVYNQLIEPQFKTQSARRALSKSTPSLSGFSLLLGLRGTSTLGHHSVFFPENYDDEFDAIFERKEPVPDPAIYICNPQDSAMTPDEQHESWFVLVNAPRHEPENGCDWTKPGFKESYAEHIIDLMERKGLEIRSRLDVCEIRTPADLESRTNAPGGSIYGTSSNGVRSAFLRAKNRSPIKNLYCVGGSAHPGGGLPLVGISAEIVAEAVEENVGQ